MPNAPFFIARGRLRRFRWTIQRLARMSWLLWLPADPIAPARRQGKMGRPLWRRETQSPSRIGRKRLFGPMVFQKSARGLAGSASVTARGDATRGSELALMGHASGSRTAVREAQTHFEARFGHQLRRSSLAVAAETLGMPSRHGIHAPPAGLWEVPPASTPAIDRNRRAAYDNEAFMHRWGARRDEPRSAIGI